MNGDSLPHARQSSLADERSEPAWPASCLLWQRTLFSALRASLPVPPPALRDAALLAPLAGLGQALEALPALLDDDWDARRPSRDLASRFSNHCLLLVFGRFNAGKSSFCNYLAQRDSAQGQAVAYFRFDDGGLTWCDEAFAEGATETTACIQGVCLGDDLVLVDTPGLYSATLANARLTRDFLECADGMLWLSSSSAPGQVQELDELGREIRRGKPLQPVLTRSDLYDEDERDGRIVSVLCNKDVQTRALQEEDVLTRARSKLQQMDVDPALLEAPLSVSIHAARLPGARAEIEQAAGMQRLDAALQRLRTHSLDYRARKHEEVVRHHLHEQVLGRVETQLLSPAERLRQTLRHRCDALPGALASVRREVWRTTLLQMPSLLDGYLAQPHIAHTMQALQQLLHTALQDQLGTALPGLSLAISTPHLPVVAAGAADPIGHDAYERLHQDLLSAAATWLDATLADLQAQAETVLTAVMQPCTRLQRIVDDARLQLDALYASLRGTQTRDA